MSRSCFKPCAFFWHPEAHIHARGGFGGNDVRGRAAINNTNAHGGAALKIVERIKPQRLVREFDNRIDAFARIKASMRGAAQRANDEPADAFARSLDDATSDGWFEHQGSEGEEIEEASRDVTLRIAPSDVGCSRPMKPLSVRGNDRKFSS